jgi:hypothetical protein
MENGAISIGEYEVDVVSLGTDRLLDLIHNVVVRKGGRIAYGIKSRSEYRLSVDTPPPQIHTIS